MPRTSAIVGGFFLAFALVYLVGFFNVETTEDLSLFAKGIGKFAVHFAFLVCAIAHVARRSDGFYWRVLGWFVAGIAVNCRLRPASSSPTRRRPGATSTSSC